MLTGAGTFKLIVRFSHGPHRFIMVGTVNTKKEHKYPNDRLSDMNELP